MFDNHQVSFFFTAELLYKSQRGATTNFTWQFTVALHISLRHIIGVFFNEISHTQMQRQLRPILPLQEISRATKQQRPDDFHVGGEAMVPTDPGVCD